MFVSFVYLCSCSYSFCTTIFPLGFNKDYPAPTYEVSQKAWLPIQDIPLLVKSQKLAMRFILPLKSRMINGETEWALITRSLEKIKPTFHIFKVKLILESSLMPCCIGGGPTYSVPCLLWSHHWGRRLQYLFDLKRYGPEERSWVHVQYIHDPPLIKDFCCQHPDQQQGPLWPPERHPRKPRPSWL